MSDTNIKNSIIKVIDDVNIFLDDDGVLCNVDSLSYIQFVAALEDAFDVEFPDELLSFTSLKKVEDFATVVQNLLLANAEKKENI